jgi:hypothetical protein
MATTLKIAGGKTVTVEIKRELVERLVAAFPGQDIEGLATIALKRLVGEAELRKFAADRQAEVQAEAKRLNEELGLE